MTSIFESVSAVAEWPFYQHVIFDCDSTLSAIEGIDVLAEDFDTQEKVVSLTDAAMSGVTPLDEVYGKRLELISPSKKAIGQLSKTYQNHMVDDTALVIGALQELGCEIYIVSGGLLEPVKEFGMTLGVSAGNIRAVDIQYDQLDGQWWKPQSRTEDQPYLAYRHSALAESHGKAEVINELLRNKKGASILFGDGVSDLLARNAVDLFVGYAGIVKRERVCAEAPLFFGGNSLLPALPLASGSRRFHKLDANLQSRCLESVQKNPPVFNRKVLEKSFLGSFI